MSKVKQERYPLRNIVLDDLFSSSKTALVLLLLVLLSAFATIWIIHITRSLNTQNGNLILERQALDNEYVNLKLEEGALDDDMRIEAIAKRHNLHFAQQDQMILLETK